MANLHRLAILVISMQLIDFVCRERDHTIQMKTVEAQLRTQISELETEIASCNTKESELLAFTERLTSQNARLQSEVTGQQARLDALSMEKSKRDAQRDELSKEIRKLVRDNKLT